MWDKVAAIAASIAAIAAAVSAWYAFDSARVAWKALESNIVYQIQKDSIDMAKDYKDAKVGPGAIIAKLHSIYYQREKGIIEDDLWSLLNYEYCRMMQDDKTLQAFWDKADKALYGQAFLNM
jgi:phenolic acid decarboxylase